MARLEWHPSGIAGGVLGVPLGQVAAGLVYRDVRFPQGYMSLSGTVTPSEWTFDDGTQRAGCPDHAQKGAG